MNRAIVSLSFLGVVGCASGDRDGGDGSQGELAIATYTTAFQDGVSPTASYAGTRDTMLEQDHPSTSHGGDPRLSVSGDTPGGSGKDLVALLRWDLAAAIPSNAIVRGARITLTVTDRADQPYSLFELLRAWDEGTATWKLASSSVDWGSNGADDATDRATASLGVIRAASTGTFTFTLNSAGIAAVQRWVDDPSTNHGVILAGTGNDNRLELQSREGSRSGRPRLEVAWDPGAGGGGTLDPTPGTYQRTCDGSGAIAIDFDHFLELSDEDQVVRIFRRAASAAPAQQLDLSGALEMGSGDEADLEDAARVGSRVYAITSHGRDGTGALQPTRYRFVGIDLSGAVPALRMTVAGSSRWLLDDMLDAASWEHPDLALLDALDAATQLWLPSVAELAPEVNGLNIEGLASDPSPTNPDRLIIGLRNPRDNGRAILVTLLNPGEVIAGGFARFGEAVRLDLGGLGVRSIAWSDAHQALLVIGGPGADTGPVRLFKWSGDPASAPVAIQDLVGPDGAAAEAVVPYPGTKDVQILFDEGGRLIGGTACKKLSSSSQSFTDLIVHVE
jgi:hypothetical protein